MARSRATPRLILGLGLTALGVIFALDELRIMDAEATLRFWPVILLAFGAAQLTSGHWLAAFAWLAVGSVLLLNNLDVIPVDLFDLWPLVLVLLGLNLVRKALFVGTSSGEDDAQVNSLAFLSGQTRRCTCSDFESGDVTAIFGGSEIDLRDADILGGERRIETFALWGGIDIRVPEQWTVVSKVGTFLGGFDNRTDSTRADPDKRLVISGLAVMGGVSVRN